MTDKEKQASKKDFQSEAERKTLVVFFPGWGGRGASEFRQLEDLLNKKIAGFEFLRVKGFGTEKLSFTDPIELANQCMVEIDNFCVGKSFSDIRFVAYSAGAVMARKVLIGAYGPEACEADFEVSFAPTNGSRNWHLKVSRIVSIAGFARGWISNPRNYWRDWLAMNFFGFLGHLLNAIPGFRNIVPLAFALRRGAPFICNTRVQWASLIRLQHRKSASTFPAIVHVMPSQDNLISTIEVIDVEADDQRKKVFYITVPDSDHRTILAVDPDVQLPSGLLRSDYLLSALCGDIDGDTLQSAGTSRFIAPSDPCVATSVHFLDDNVPCKPDESVVDYVFIVHGIRDTGAWAKKIAGEIHAQRARDGLAGRLVTDTQSYGYFTAFPFLLPWVRGHKVEWLMDRYATAKALYPKARISFVGHSNGTYLAAAGLQRYTTCSFHRIVFAGSVVRQDFDWVKKVKGNKAMSNEGQRVKSVVNYVATGDSVVAFFPDGFRRLVPRFDLGGAGHHGFSNSTDVENVCWVVGDHSAGIQEHTWKQTARFILDGTIPVAQPKDSKAYDSKQSRWILTLNFCAPALLLVLALVVLLVEANLLFGVMDLPKLTLMDGVSKLTGQLVSLATWENALWDEFRRLHKSYQTLLSAAFSGLLWYGLFRF